MSKNMADRIVEVLEEHKASSQMAQASLAAILIGICKYLGMSKEDMLDAMDEQWDDMDQELDS